jgi:hypothetical protein
MDLTDAFEAGARDAWQLPLSVIDALALTGTESAIDVGAGTGYFARHLAPRVSRLIAVDPVFSGRLRESGFESVASLEEVRAPVDLVFAANVLRFLSEADRQRIATLAPRLVLIDWRPEPRPVGPSESVAIDEAIASFPAFRLGPAHDFLPYQWMIELRRT